MSSEFRRLKDTLRQKASARVKELTAAQRTTASAQARALLAQQALWQNAHSILFFAPMPEEVDVWPLLDQALAAGRIVALPRFIARTKNYVACRVRDIAQDVAVGYYGIREPVERCAQWRLHQVDLILVPGVAFDLHGGRLGRGRGYYDQLLKAVRGTTCGVAFDEQIVDEIPVEAHDVRLNYLLTPTRWLEV